MSPALHTAGLTVGGLALAKLAPSAMECLPSTFSVRKCLPCELLEIGYLLAKACQCRG